MRMHLAKRLTVASTAVAALMSPALACSPASAATVQPAIDCSQDPLTNQHLDDAWVRQNNVQMRTGPDRSCGTGSNADAQVGDNVTLHCAELGADGFLWVYYTDHTPTGRTGWSRANFLGWNGGLISC